MLGCVLGDRNGSAECSLAELEGLFEGSRLGALDMDGASLADGADEGADEGADIGADEGRDVSGKVVGSSGMRPLSFNLSNSRVNSSSKASRVRSLF